jgi:hypothetical protein
MKKILSAILVIAVAFLVFVGLKNKKSEILISENLDNNTQATKEKEKEAHEIFGYVSNDQVGIFKINAPIPDLDTLSRNGYSINETTSSVEGDPYKLYTVSKDGKIVLTFAVFTADKISEIRVKSSEFRTSEDIAVGSTLSDFIKAYPNYKLWYTAEEGEKFILNTTKDAATPQFFLFRNDLVNPKGDFYKTGIKVSDFKADAKINDIRVFYYPY